MLGEKAAGLHQDLLMKLVLVHPCEICSLLTFNPLS